MAFVKCSWSKSESSMTLTSLSLPGAQRCCMHSSTMQCSEKKFKKIHVPTIINAQWLNRNRGTALFGPLLGKGLCCMQKEVAGKTSVRGTGREQ